MTSAEKNVRYVANTSGKLTIFTAAAPAPLMTHFAQIMQARVNFSKGNPIASETR